MSVLLAPYLIALVITGALVIAGSTLVIVAAIVVVLVVTTGLDILLVILTATAAVINSVFQLLVIVTTIVAVVINPVYQIFRVSVAVAAGSLAFSLQLCLVPLMSIIFIFDCTRSAIRHVLNWWNGIILIWRKGLVIKNGLILNKKMIDNDRYETIKYIFPFKGKHLTLIHGYIRRIQIDCNTTTIPMDIINMIFRYYTNINKQFLSTKYTMIYKALNNRFNSCYVGSQIDILCDPSNPAKYAIPIRSFGYHKNKKIKYILQKLYILSVLVDKSISYIMRWIIDRIPCGVFLVITISATFWPISLYMIGLRNRYDLKSNTWSP